MDVKSAVQKAAEYISGLYVSIDGLRVEVVRIHQEDQSWSITFSFFDPDTAGANAISYISNRPRIYKVIRMNAAGDFVEMSMSG